MKKFLTYAPLIKRIRSGEYEELAIFNYDLLSQVTVKQKWYRIAGTTQTYSYTETVTGNRFTIVLSTPDTETFSATSKIEVWAEYNSEIVTEVRTYLPDFTSRKKPTRLAWINTLGGVDTYTFTGIRTSEIQGEKVLYQKDIPTDFTRSDRGQAISSSLAFEEFEIISDFETEDVYRWLSGIIYSPEVWLIDSSGILPIMVTSKAHPVETENMIQFKIKYRLASDKIVQNG